jgi:hypothetical protein
MFDQKGYILIDQTQIMIKQNLFEKQHLRVLQWF